MPTSSSKDTSETSPNSRVDPIFDDDHSDIDDPLSHHMDETHTSHEQLKALRKRAEDILEQKKLEQELGDYDLWNHDWDD